VNDSVTLKGISELRGLFRTNRTPIYFISSTAFNLLGIDRWVGSFFYVNYFDSFEGTHPHVLVPRKVPHEQFRCIEDVCNYLLSHEEVLAFIHRHGRTGKAVFVFFDELSERLAEAAGLEVALPSAELRHRLDSKIVTTRLANEAGVPSVPNVLGRAGSYRELLALATKAGLGEDLVVQTPYGDSGKTTFFIRRERDWDVAASELASQELKVMRRIRPRAVAVEACVTRHGTVVGPLMVDLYGHPELTPYRGGWCGNQIAPGALPPALRERAWEMSKRLGDRLAREGYRGQLEIDYLVDADSGELYLGELNPRLSGISSMTNVSAHAYADMPLFLFHLAEYLDVDYALDIDEINLRWSRGGLEDSWSQIILKEPADTVELLDAAPRTGIWRLGDGGEISFVRTADDWHALRDMSEGFYLRILGPGDWRYKGADLGILVTRAQLQSEQGTLTDLCRAWIDALRARFHGVPAIAGQTAQHDALAVKAS
jgi:biotin carboxylase